MKKLIFTIAAAITAVAGSAQWTTLNSTTTNHLRDVDFIDPNYGVIVGDGGIILRTVDGGLNWSDINNSAIHGDLFAVSLLNTDTIFVSAYDWSTTTATVYLTVDAGANWNSIATTNVTNHKFDLEPNGAQHMFATGSDLIGSSDLGADWDTFATNIASITAIDHLCFADGQTGHASGLISGWITYSTAFYRTEDNGVNWHPADVFSFSNADAFTTMCFIDPDTAYMFTNHYAGFSPSNQNGFVKLYGFNKIVPSGDTNYAFTSQIINPATPAFMNDAFFFTRDTGFTAANDGNVYKTNDGGISWAADYTGSGSSPMRKMKFINGTGYAVGYNGVLIKYTGTVTGIETAENNSDLVLYPVPVSEKLMIRSDAFAANTNASILDITGKVVARFTINSPLYSFDASSLDAGVYFLSYTDINGEVVRAKWLKQ